MEPEIQVHILDNLKELNKGVAAIAQGQHDSNERFDKLVVWVKGIEDKTDLTQKQVNDLNTWKSITAWQMGTLSAGAGAALSFAAQWVAVKLGFKLH